MKRLYNTVTIIICLFLNTACNDNYGIEQIVPQENHKVLSLKYSGVIEPDMNFAEYRFDIVILKGGAIASLEANAVLRVFTADELRQYNEENDTDYKLVPKEYYSLPQTVFNFSSNDYSKITRLRLNLVALSYQMDLTEEQFILPFKLTSEKDPVLDSKENIMFLFR